VVVSLNGALLGSSVAGGRPSGTYGLVLGSLSVVSILVKGEDICVRLRSRGEGDMKHDPSSSVRSRFRDPVEKLLLSNGLECGVPEKEALMDLDV